MLLSAKGIGETQALADVVFSRGLGILIFIAFLADEQQWRKSITSIAVIQLIIWTGYYEARETYRKTAKVPAGYHQEDLDRGFNTTGMYAWSRHPNFAAEQSFWISIYAWGAYTTRGYLNWTVASPICYMLLFQGSTWLTELISQRKYPQYMEYRKRVGRFMPRLPGGPPGDFSDERKGK